MSKSKITVYDMAIVGVMAAMVFVTTYFIKIEIPTPVGPTMLKLANAVCLLSGMLFGGIRGGLAAGIGSMLFDLTNPAYVSSAPFTLIRFFLMAAVCGIICTVGRRKNKPLVFYIVGGIIGSLVSILLYIGENVLTLVIAGSGFSQAVIANATKMVTSGINGVLAVVVAVPLALVMSKALQRYGLVRS